jgi:hypothetical protein
MHFAIYYHGIPWVCVIDHGWGIDERKNEGKRLPKNGVG